MWSLDTHVASVFFFHKDFTRIDTRQAVAVTCRLLNKCKVRRNNANRFRVAMLMHTLWNNTKQIMKATQTLTLSQQCHGGSISVTWLHSLVFIGTTEYCCESEPKQLIVIILIDSLPHNEVQGSSGNNGEQLQKSKAREWSNHPKVTAVIWLQLERCFPQ